MEDLELAIGESSSSSAESMEHNGERVIVLTFYRGEDESTDLSLTMSPERALEVISELTYALRTHLCQL